MSTPADIVNRQIQDSFQTEEVLVSNARLISKYFGINNFLSEVDPFKFKLAKANKTLVEFFPNSSMYNSANSVITSENTSKLSFYCLGVEIPGRTLATTEINIHGPAYKAPNQSTYNEVTLTLLCDDSLKQKKFFDDWMDYINPKNNFTFKYRDDYIGEIVITQFSDYEHKKYSVTLTESYPIDVKPLSSNWGEKEYHKIQITMTYKYWRENKIPDKKA
jgi:hypothetical protein